MIDLDALEHYMNECKAQGFTHAGNPEMWLALIAELRAARNVVEAAREMVSGSTVGAEARLVINVRRALAELEVLR